MELQVKKLQVKKLQVQEAASQLVPRQVKEEVKEKYGSAARDCAGRKLAACCDLALRCCDPSLPISTAPMKRDSSREGCSGSLGCGNPTALIELKPGEVVLDLGSGGGIDVLLSARRVGQPARVRPGHDRRLLALARENQRRAGVEMLNSSKAKSKTFRWPAAPSMW